MTTLVRTQTTTELFDDARDALLASDVHTTMTQLSATLRGLRARLAPDDWTAVVADARRHPLHHLLLESPFARRAYVKPRGYAGDAVMMDLIYGATPAEDLSPIGGLVFAYEFDSGCFHSVRARRAILAHEIDDVASRRPGARILSVACGHLREIEWSRAARSGAVAITAVDQDRDSLDFVAREYAKYGVATVPASVGDLLRRTVRFDNVDLAYAAGLYDYLDDDVARALTATLFRSLAPGGRLLVANFTPATHDAAYMETFMDWRLVYRTEQQVRAFAASIPPERIAAIDQFADRNGHVTYLRVTRR